MILAQMNQDENLISFIDEFLSTDQSCFDAFQNLDLSQCSHDVLYWTRMIMQKFIHEKNISKSSNSNFPYYNEKSLSIQFQIELEIRKYPERCTAIPQWDDLYKIYPEILKISQRYLIRLD